ncbi:unnamed protein product [Didymodactylos carnosus]|uniref:Tetratricopeptide SHNi-TPR domain-containing protein n=1 Tax=Didymodactylos carnosus TaxID=1234261 RepID=A0A813SRB1_9BILA|nr:unnamed protein product [Didymodactylos carnosus]CAF0803585.1 unnamed protein product [Didymodactylos carnosus]CAF3512805.1 unnamed protein product [Didymodactylos carnosus]CAF3588841.1 unnamed protein product [Didymodactylos carnosus]
MAEKFEIHDEEANNYFKAGKRDVLLHNYQSACDQLSKACDRLVHVYNSDTHIELAEPYFYFGQALLALALGEQTVLGEAVAQEESGADDDDDDDEQSSDEDEQEKTDGVDEKMVDGKDEKTVDGVDEKTVDDKTNGIHTKENEKVVTNNHVPENGDESMPEKVETETKDNPMEENDDDADPLPDDNNMTDLQRSFEILECSHMIYRKTSSDDNHSDYVKCRLADIHMMLSEVCSENGDYDSSRAHIQEAIDLQENLAEKKNRLLAESYYKLGCIYETIEKFAESVEYFDKAIKFIHYTLNDSTLKPEDIEELKQLLPSIESKRDDVKSSIGEEHLIEAARNIVAGQPLSTTAIPAPVQQAKDITLNIRHKKPTTNGEQQQKRSIDQIDNGEGEDKVKKLKQDD